jgi:rubredoxin
VRAVFQYAPGDVRSSGANMPRWTLKCDNCNFEFTHSLIEDSGLVSFLEPSKPEFPEGGSELECPNCRHKDTFQRTELTYHA